MMEGAMAVLCEHGIPYAATLLDHQYPASEIRHFLRGAKDTDTIVFRPVEEIRTALFMCEECDA